MTHGSTLEGYLLLFLLKELLHILSGGDITVDKSILLEDFYVTSSSAAQACNRALMVSTAISEEVNLI